MPVRRARRAAAVALLLFGSVAIGSTTPARAQVAEPTVTVSPAVDLLDSQVVRFSGTGFPADTTLYTGQCPPGVIDDPLACDQSTVRTVSTDAEGSFTLDMTVRRFLINRTVDCAAGGCILGATDLADASAGAPTDFLDVAFDEQVTVSPTADLVDGEPVTVSGTGYPADMRVTVRQCEPGATVLSECDLAPSASAYIDAEGTFTREVDVRRMLIGSDGTTVDCAAVSCSIVVFGTSTQFVPIDFADVPLPTVTVTPSTDLLEYQMVELTGTGFVPDADLVFGTCRSGTAVPIFGDCQPGWPFLRVASDASGSFTVDLRVERYLSGGDDCVEAACAVVGFAGSRPLGVEAPISFADVPPPARTVEALTGDLVDGATATVVGSGFRPDATLDLRQCPAAPASPSDCSSLTHTAQTDSEGEWATELTIRRVLWPLVGPMVDCAVETCTIGVSSDPRLPVSEPLDIVDPGLTVDLAPDATLLAGTNEVVAQLTVSCEVATPVSVRAAVAQPGIEGTWALDGRSCAPDDPLLVFVRTSRFIVGDVDFTLGDAELTANVAATIRFVDTDPRSVLIEASGTIVLHDHAAIVAAVQNAIADPANDELRAEVRHAIRVRLDQDPVFRRQWRFDLG